MTTKKSGVNLHPKLPRTPGPRTRGRSNRAVGGRGVSPVTTGRYGRNSLSMQDAMNLAAEAATEADAKANKPARSSKKAQHSRGRTVERPDQSAESSTDEVDDEDQREERQEDSEEREEDSEDESDSGESDRRHAAGEGSRNRAQEPVSSPRASAYEPETTAGRRTLIRTNRRS